MDASFPADGKQAFADYVVECMAAFAPVAARRMFGGYGIYREGLMFALIADDQLYFKADGLSKERFIRQGLRPFTYVAKARAVSLGYYEAPPDVFDEPGAMAEWASVAFESALRARRPAAGKRTKASP